MNIELNGDLPSYFGLGLEFCGQYERQSGKHGKGKHGSLTEVYSIFLNTCNTVTSGHILNFT